MDCTKKQLSDVFVKHLNRGKGLQDWGFKGRCRAIEYFEV
jgi:hypothetical protein